MGLTSLRFKFNGGLGDGRGWVGDVRSMLLDVMKLKSLGWIPGLNVGMLSRKLSSAKLHRLGNGVLDSVKKPRNRTKDSDSSEG
jgi:hypothetical protein